MSDDTNNTSATGTVSTGVVPDPEDIFESASDPVSITIDPYGELTTTDEIRAVFGLSAAELPDEMLSQRVYTRAVQTAFAKVDAQLATKWEGIKTDALEATVQTVALYCICSQICDVLPIIAARTLTDSKASFQRFDTDLQDVITLIRNRYSLALKDFTEILTDVTSTLEDSLPTILVVASPSYDPVTG